MNGLMKERGGQYNKMVRNHRENTWGIVEASRTAHVAHKI